MAPVGGCSRRAFLGAAAVAAALGVAGRPGAAPAGGGRDGAPEREPDFERRHRPTLRMPAVTENGAWVPVVVEMEHPMTADHAVTTVHVVNERDPVPSKGVFHLTPANGQVYLALQVRLDQGASRVVATATCNRHGAWSSARAVTVADGAGGCAGPVAPARGGDDDIRPPLIRIPALVKHGRVRAGEVIDVQVKVRHPSRTGLAYQQGRWVAVAEPFYIESIEVFHGARPVSRFELTPALSDDPFLVFRLRADRAAPVRVVLRNSRGRSLQAEHDLPLA
jgi:sulfur-oxidizing protein SoxY